jgi:hypothetical protein
MVSRTIRSSASDFANPGFGIWPLASGAGKSDEIKINMIEQQRNDLRGCTIDLRGIEVEFLKNDLKLRLLIPLQSKESRSISAA